MFKTDISPLQGVLMEPLGKHDDYVIDDNDEKDNGEYHDDEVQIIF